MRKVPRSLAFAGVLLLLVISLSGCTVGRFAWVYPQSHFAPPNSNIVPLGRVQAEDSIVWVFFPVMQDADLQETVHQMAIKQKGGDILIDYVGITEIVLYPVPYINIYVTTYKVDGTAAKIVEIGKKELR